jgi:hypothetical protein
MLTEQEIQQALHASRVVPLNVPSPHGPLGLEHLAGVVARLNAWPGASPDEPRIRRPIALSVETWEKLDQLARAAARTSSHPRTASEMASAILEQLVATPPA